MTSKSKAKGNRLEREMRDLLNQAFETEEFARTPSSGAIMGLSNYEKNQNLEDSTKKALGSDIICPSWFRFSIECKNYGDKPNLGKLINDYDTDLDGWIGEALFDAINSKRTPLLFFRTSRKGTYCVLPYHFMDITNAEMNNFLRYHEEFMIVDASVFFKLAKVIQARNERSYDSIQEWLTISSKVDTIKNKMLTKKGKK